MRSVASVVIILLLTASLSQAASAAEHTVTIDFETLSRGEIVEDQYASEGVVIRAEA